MTVVDLRLVFHRDSMQQTGVEVARPLAAVRAESPVRGIDALLPSLPLQSHEGAAVRIQRWYRHRQAERSVRLKTH